ncbi:uncharacterized protein LOC128296628 [Gossypium arboreum]|uniref:uncharacterized protein LOC128296628 n=1 Tax=Gossypium arboreum TaxID=29729 RepID=UPI0022F14BE2|nr:uncharacterized protein LOC128296628 [Gossypium arboreum]
MKFDAHSHALSLPMSRNYAIKIIMLAEIGTMSSSRGKKVAVLASKKRKRASSSSGPTADVRHPFLRGLRVSQGLTMEESTEIWAEGCLPIRVTSGVGQDSMLRRYHSDPTHVISTEEIEVKLDLTFEEEPVKILDRDVKVLRKKSILLVKVLWHNHNLEDAT